MEPKVLAIEKLEGESNWLDWKFQVKIQLQAYGLMSVVDGSCEAPTPPGEKFSDTQIADYKSKVEAFNRSEYMAQNIIVSSVTSKVRQLINMTTSAKEMWDKLNGIFEQRTEQRQDRLFNMFFGIQEKDPCENIATHIAKLEKLWTELTDETWKEDKVKLPESLFMNRVLNTLPKEYMEFTNAWESVPKEHRTVSMLLERLCTVEQRLMEKNGINSGLQGLFVSHGREKDRASKQSSSEYLDQQRPKPPFKKKSITCFRCNQVGHYKSQCTQNKTRNFAQGKKSGRSAFIGLSYELVDKNEKWVADSGATQHITNRRDWFSTWEEFVTPREVFVGNGQKMSALGQGNINVQLLVDGNWTPGYLKNVWYIPQAGRNLFSVLSSLDKGMTATMNKTTCKIEKDGELKAIAERDGGLYFMKMKVEVPQIAALVEDSNTLQVWHERLCHQNKRYVATFLNNQGVVVSGSGKDFCEACVYGKHHRLSFGVRQLQYRGEKPCDLIHADVCGPMSTLSLGGARYFLCFKDDFSKFRSVYFLKEKSEVSEKLKDFLCKVKTLGHTVKELLTDGGREFDCCKFRNIVSQTGLNHRIVMPYCPEQNGAAERENRTLVEAARSMIHAKNLPEYLWAEAINTAAYVLNRSAGTPVSGKTPIELWSGKKENLNHLRIFGTVCFVHVPSQRRKKWDKKAVKGHLVGYCEHDGYRVWVPERKTVVFSKHVSFKPETVVPEVEDSSESFVYVPVNPNSTTSEVRGRESEDTSEVDRMSTLGEVKASSPMRLRDRATLKSPDYYGEWANVAEEEPQSVEEALSSPDSKAWKAAMDEEMASLVENNTWELVDLPAGRKIVSNKWVLKRKFSANGSVSRYKARLVACGYSQKKGVDYFDTFSPVARFDTIRTVLAVAAKEKLILRQFDVKTAFLNGFLDAEIYMEQPRGYNDGTDRVCRLLRSLYGLKQAPRCWNKRFSTYLKKIGLQQSSADPCLFTRNGEKKLVLCLFVDDGLVAGSDVDTVEAFLSDLKEEFKITSGPLEQYLGINIEESDTGIFLGQEVYVKKILEKFRMNESHLKSTPMEVGFVTSGVEECPLNSQVPYREAIGCLMYLAVATRPDIAFTVNYLAQAIENPQEYHWAAVKRVFRYLCGTIKKGLFYSRTGTFLEAYCDADYASDPKERKSVSGCVCCYAGGAITWFSRKQRCTATSSTEAEYVSGSEAAKELVWLRQILKSISSQKEEQPTLWVDNLGAVKLAKNPTFHKLSKHIDVRFHFLREKYEEGVFKLEHISGEDQIADILTKPLPSVRFNKLCEALGLVEQGISSRGSVDG